MKQEFQKSKKPQYQHKFHKVNKSTEEFKKELEEEYGSVNINLTDGTYTPIEKEEDKKEE